MVTKKGAVARIAATALVVGLTGASLSACSSSSGGSDSSADPTSGNLSIGMNQGLIPQFQTYVDDYNKTNPDVKITLAPVPDNQSDYIQQLVTEGLSNTVPDIVFNYDTLNTTLQSNGLLYDLKPWLDAGKDGLSGSSYVPAFLNQYNSDDGSQITGIPVSADSTMLFYNKTLFAKAGITDLPTSSWTMDDLYRVSKEITAASGGSYWGIRTPMGAGDAIFVDYPALKAGGSTIYNPDTKKFEFADAKGIAVWKTLLAPYTEGWGSPYPDAAQDVNYFSGGQAAMSLDTRPAIAKDRTTLTDDWDVANLPTLDGNPTVGGGSYALSISAKSNNKELAWAFMAWFYSADGGMAAAAPNGVIPATTEGLTNGAWLKDTNPIPANLIPATQYAVTNAALPPAIPQAAATQLAPTLKQAAQEVVLGGKSVEEAYGAAQDTLNALLQ